MCGFLFATFCRGFFVCGFLFALFCVSMCFLCPHYNALCVRAGQQGENFSVCSRITNDTTMTPLNSDTQNKIVKTEEDIVEKCARDKHLKRLSYWMLEK